MSKNKGLRYEMRQHIKTYDNATTQKQYKKSAIRFCDFIQESGFTANAVRAAKKEYLQKYSDYLQGKSYSPSTIHTYLAFPCEFFKVDMKLIKKPKRTIDKITRSRGNGNELGNKELLSDKFSRIVKFQQVVGIRRAELKRLAGNDFMKDESGYWCVRVKKGKGGKTQMQRIADVDIEFVRSFFDGTKNRIFTAKEMKNKIDFHAMRGEHARQMYAYYDEQCQDPMTREKLLQELADRFCVNNKHYLLNGKKRHLLTKFLNETEGMYKIRGKSVEVAKANGRPLVYDKLALMCVSVFHLAHWRNDVTVAHYMLS